jgi:hypothetical protein
MFGEGMHSIKKPKRITGIMHNHFLPQLRLLRQAGLIGSLRWNLILLNTLAHYKLNWHTYRVLSEPELHATRKSDKVFIFGSGYSLNDVSPAEWRHFEQHDTLGFSGFVYQKWCRVDYHLIRGWIELKVGTFNWRKSAMDFANVLNANPHFRDTIFILQGEYMAQFGNALVGYGLLRPDSRIFRYTTARAPGPPTRSLSQGLRHMVATLCDAVNFAYCLGWQEIVLVGVDLYDSRYFWLKPDETLSFDEATGTLTAAQYDVRGLRYDQTHNTARNNIVEIMGQWREVFEEENVHMSVYNPRSLLTQAMPVYEQNEPNR